MSQILRNAILDVCYPRTCNFCLKKLELHYAGSVCQHCLESIGTVDLPYCQVCGEKFFGNITSLFNCPNCKNEEFYFSFAYAGALARGRLRQAVHNFKYGKRRHLRKGLAQILLRAFEEPRLQKEKIENMFLVPIPLHWRKMRKRGFNQAKELCIEIRRAKKIPIFDLLKRVKNTTAQASLTRKQRKSNLINAFSARKRKLRLGEWDFSDKTALLVDDVLTTGSTANECARILKKNFGCKKVIVLTIARG